MQSPAEFLPQPASAEVSSAPNFDLNEEFDLEEFFSQPLTAEEEQREREQKDLIVTLRDESESTVATFVSKVTAETFPQGVSTTMNVFGSLGNLIGACGALCLHGLAGAGGGVGSGLSAAGAHVHGLGDLGKGLTVDNHGNFHLSGSLNELSRSTGLSRSDILSGKYSAEGILAVFMNCFGQGVGAFGFDLIEVLFDGLIPTPQPA